jgi:PHO85 cyclin-6/7
LAFHHINNNTGSADFKAGPSTQTSPVNATPHPPSVTLRPIDQASSSTNSPNSMPSPPRIKVQSLSHIQSFVIDDTNPLSPSRNNSRIAIGGQDFSPQYEISEMPVAEIIEMVAGLLTKITTTNDRQHEYDPRHIHHDSAHGNAQATSVLAFHGKNVPSISILSYLSRIHKYCPTTYEVFLSLLVYFDRMTEHVNAGPIISLRQANQQSVERHSHAHATEPRSRPARVDHPVAPWTSTQTPPDSGSSKPTLPHGDSDSPPSPPIYPSLDSTSPNLSQFFVVDSFNIHRLVIAGVTCASKFFSDIFYTNSRYAKVLFPS